MIMIYFAGYSVSHGKYLSKSRIGNCSLFDVFVCSDKIHCDMGLQSDLLDANLCRERPL